MDYVKQSFLMLCQQCGIIDFYIPRTVWNDALNEAFDLFSDYQEVAPDTPEGNDEIDAKLRADVVRFLDRACHHMLDEATKKVTKNVALAYAVQVVRLYLPLARRVTPEQVVGELP